jgi:cell division protein FtsB
VRRHPWLVVSILALLGVLALGSFPVRAYLDQLHQREQLAGQVRTLEQQNQKLVDQAAQLQSDGTIEQLARDRYQMVKPGEEAYSILPTAAAASPSAVPSAVPSATPPR